MARSLQRGRTRALDLSEDPAVGGGAPWPLPIVLALAAAGLLSPLIPLAAAVLAYGIADEDQGTFLLGAGLVHVLLVLTLLPG